MKVEWLNNDYIRFIKKAVRALEEQHRAISENVANVSNPGYVRKRTEFMKFLERQEGKGKLATTRGKHIPGLKDVEFGLMMKGEKEEVDVSREMMELAENQVRHDFVTRVLRGIYNKLNSSIAGKIR